MDSSKWTRPTTAKQPRNLRPMDQPIATVSAAPLLIPDGEISRRVCSPPLLACICRPDAQYRAGHFIHIGNDEDRQKLIFTLEMLLAILRDVSSLIIASPARPPYSMRSKAHGQDFIPPVDRILASPNVGTVTAMRSVALWNSFHTCGFQG
jgi:hypothetical protein